MLCRGYLGLFLLFSDSVFGQFLSVALKGGLPPLPAFEAQTNANRLPFGYNLTLNYQSATECTVPYP